VAARDFFNSRPEWISQSWFSELMLDVREAGNIVLHRAAGTEKFLVDPLERQSLHDGRVRNYVADRDRAAVYNLCEAIQAPPGRDQRVDLREVQKHFAAMEESKTRGGHKAGVSFFTPEFFPVAKEFITHFATLLRNPSELEAGIALVARGLVAEQRWKDWCTPGAMEFPDQTEVKFERPNRRWWQTDPRKNTAFERTDIWGTTLAMGEASLDFRRGLTPAVSASPALGSLRKLVERLEARCEAFLPEAEPIQHLQFNGAFGIFPSEHVMQRVMALQESVLVKGKPTDAANGLRTVFPEELIRSRLADNAGVLCVSQHRGQMQAVYLVCPSNVGRRAADRNEKPDPELAQQIDETLGRPPREGFFLGKGSLLADLAVTNRDKLSRITVGGDPLYSVLTRRVEGIAETEFESAPGVSMNGICRVWPQPNQAIVKHVREGWEVSGETLEESSGGETQRFAILSKTHLSAFNEAFKLYQAGLLK
jgi:hypothetical protein